jgi:hypothetical protein
VNFEKSVRLYRWAPRTEVAYLQSIIDSHEGIARVRTERHQDTESLLFFLTTESRKNELLRLLEYFKQSGIPIRDFE